VFELRMWSFIPLYITSYVPEKPLILYVIEPERNRIMFSFVVLISRILGARKTG
jgi:hypothetical protein